MSETITIKIAEQFSKHPAGRTRQDGKFSGQRFREEFLEAPLKRGDRVRIVLDGARSYGSSFLEEAFGGLIRTQDLSRGIVERNLEIVALNRIYETYMRRAYNFIKEAR